MKIPAIPLFSQGLSRGEIVEIAGSGCSGRMSAGLHILAQATVRGEICAVVDLHNQFHPASAENFGVHLPYLVWIRCSGRIEHAIRSADLLLHAGGFGIVLLDLCGADPRLLNKIPLSYWFRFRRALASTSTILLVTAEYSQAKSSALTVLDLKSKASIWRGDSGARLLTGAVRSASLRRSNADALLTFPAL